MMMHTIGRDASIPDLQRQRMKRVKKGECPECGTLLFKKSMLRKATPLTIKGKCWKGRCLVCFPLNASEEEEAARKIPIPQEIVTCCALKSEMDGTITVSQDNGNVGNFIFDQDDNVSAITLDRRIRTECEKIDQCRVDENISNSAEEDQDSVLTVSESESQQSLILRMAEYLKEDSQEEGLSSPLFEEMLARWEQKKSEKKQQQQQQQQQQQLQGSYAQSQSNDIQIISDLLPEAIQPPRPDEHHSPSPKQNSKRVFQQPKQVFVIGSSSDSNDISNNASNRSLELIRKETAAHILQGSLREIAFDSDDEDGDDDDEPGQHKGDDDDDDDDHWNVHSDKNTESEERPLAISQRVPVKFATRTTSGVATARDRDEASCTETGYSMAAIMEFSITHHNDTDWFEDNCHGEEVPVEPTTTMATTTTATTCHIAVELAKAAQEAEGQPPLPPLSPALSDSKPAATVKKPLPAAAEPDQMVMTLMNASFFEIDKIDYNDATSTLDALLSELQTTTNNQHSNGQSSKYVDDDHHELVLRRLTEYIWKNNVAGRRAFVASGGLPILTSVLWMNMTHPLTATAAAGLILALFSRGEDSRQKHSTRSTIDETDHDDLELNPEEAEGVVDALLITMQTLIMDEGLQQAGCRVLCALAGRASVNTGTDIHDATTGSNNVNYDGTNAGAVLTVLNAMDAHATSPVVQEWGLRALCRQCADSPRSEANQRTVLSSTSQLHTTGATGAKVLERLLVQYDKNHADHLKDGSVLEWACQLCWILTAGSDSVAEVLALRIDALRELLHILEQCRSIPDASAHLQQAVLGVIANLARTNRYRSFLGSSDVILLILDTMHTNKQSMEVQIEACNVIANISSLLSPVERDEIVDSGAVRTIVGAMFAFKAEKTTIQEPALRALVGLTLKSELTKEDVCEPDTLSVLMQLCRLDGRSTLLQQEMLCSLIASIYASDRLQSKAIKCDTFGALTAAMVAYSKSETIQSACLTAYRNLTRQNLENLARGREVCLAVNSMITFRFNKSIQINACCVLWNMSAGTKLGHQIIVQTRAVECIVHAIQTYLDDPEVVEIACGALWGLIHQSPALRQQFLDVDGGVEAVACTLVMHGDSVAILEKACGILAIAASASSPACATAVAADGVINVVEAFRRNPRSLVVLEHGAHFLRAALQYDASVAADGSGALAVLVDALKDFPQADGLVREACYFIWAIAGLSREAKSKVIALDGESVLLWLLDHRSGSAGIEDAALGAFRELAMAPSG